MEVQVKGAAPADDSDALLRTTLDGLGVGLLPTWLTTHALEIGRPRSGLTDWSWSIAPGPERTL